MDGPLTSERPEVQRWLQALESCRDLLQDLILKATETLPAIEAPELWLEVTARHLGVLPEARRRRPAASGSASPAELLPRDRTLELAAALALLPLTERKFLVLRAMNFSAQDIARRAGYHPSSVRKVVRQGCSRLAAILDGSPPVGRPPRTRSASRTATVEPAAGLSTSPRSRRSNRSHLRRFARWLGAEDPEAALAELLRGGAQAAEEMMARYRTAMLDSGLSEHTVKNRLSVLRVAVRLVADHGLVEWQLPGTR